MQVWWVYARTGQPTITISPYVTPPALLWSWDIDWRSLCNDVGGKRYFAPSDTELLRALHSRNSKNIRNPLIFLQKMASYSCFWRVPSSKILLQASLHRIYDLLTLVSNQLQIIEMIKIKYKICNQNKGWGMICQGKEEKKIKKECV